ncbi:methionyl-tRNA formyltransferase [Candidatus Micrarchaeota archaeon]|nr:methionyl-tRNA formyltransferase [Candidatus Micrarchaeota archaeon]
MKILFVSGVKLGYDCVTSLIDQGQEICGIVTYPEIHAKRSGYVDFGLLQKKNPKMPIIKGDIKDPIVIKQIESLKPDLILVIGYSFLIPNELLKLPKYGTVGHHPTLLPKHRGNAPIPWTLINGLKRSGITFFYLKEEIDSGDIVASGEFEVEFEDDASTLYEKITKKTVEIMHKMIEQMNRNTLKTSPQNPERSSKWPKRRPEDGIIDWNVMSIYLYNWIRGLTHPYPGAFTFYQNKKLLIWKAKIANRNSDQKIMPGTITQSDEKVFVKTGDGELELIKVSFENEEDVEAAEFIKKNNIKKDEHLG